MSKDKKIKQLLFDIAVVDTQLNGMAFSHADVVARTKLLRFKFMLQSELSLYSDEEIKAVKKPKVETRKSIIVEEEIIEKKEVAGSLYIMLMTYIAFSDVKNKGFLMLAVELLAKDVIYERKTIQKII
jgi:hypothetical protein